MCALILERPNPIQNILNWSLLEAETPGPQPGERPRAETWAYVPQTGSAPASWNVNGMFSGGDRINLSEVKINK